VADDPGNIMAALLQSYATPKANISKAIKTISTTNTTTKTFSHNLAATTISTLLNNLRSKTNQQPTTTTISPSIAKTPANIKGAKEAPKRHEKGNGKGKEWIGCWD
jgi:hypothetical protein